MEDRNLEHFSGRLEKETYTKDEVAGLLHSEAEFSTRTATKGMIAQTEYEALQADLNSAKEALAPYKQKEFNDTIGTEFKKLNGNLDRQGDLVKLAGITMDDTPELATEKIAKIKESGSYDFLFKKVDEGIKPAQTQPTKKAESKEFTPTYGAGFFAKMFKK